MFFAVGVSAQTATSTTATTTPPIPPPVPGDTVAPTTPQNVSVVEDYDYTAPTSGPETHNAVVVVWDKASDNVGVTGYDVYRGGVKIGSSPLTQPDDFRHNNRPHYIDLTTKGYTKYSYHVTALDAAANASEQSTIVSLVTGMRAGALVKTIKKSTVYGDVYATNRTSLGSQPAGVEGSVVRGPVYIGSCKARCNYTGYFQVNFTKGISGWVLESNVQGVLNVASVDRVSLALLNSLEEQLNSLLAKIIDLKAVLVAAAASASR